MKPLRSALLLVLLGPAGRAAPPTPPAPAVLDPAPKKESSSGWVFSLLPKSLQKNPRLELTVITELTAAGKKRPPVSPQAPAYFEAFTTGPRHLGHAPANEKTLAPAQIEKLLTQSLATNGYLPARPPEVPPTILITYVWGSHNVLTEGDAENPSLSGEQLARNILDRAALVGGAKFAERLLDLFTQADALSLAASSRPPPGGEAVFTPGLLDFANPVNLFKRASAKNEFLVDQTASDIYYVVATAYDYQSAATNRRIVLWRTRMTVAAQGVSQEQTLPTLVLSAAPYFGREMSEPEILTKRAVREGSVEIGTPTVVEPAPNPARK